MFRISSEKELLESFRLVDREQVILPEALSFPLLVKDYLSWSEPSGHRIFLVLPNLSNRKSPLGIVFRRDQSSGGTAARMCEWCHAIRGGDGVGLLAATASAHRSVGVQVCRDLSCKDKVEKDPGVDDMRESGSQAERIRRIVARMSEFARKNLF